ncbi:MAG: hypothetical protein Q8K43_01515 [Sulfurimicrobium sp.]|jgi:hypothetical protein|nr:hypothetical protein [Sulfurimicrobium sp.]MDP1705321.1 hypothetical protein [Sulfurimicrobium sp.]MDP1896543.1 hypothetical protein [Sulfurimicrobium sp.]MDP2199888.1 hypothetical protein [Sulfurimicrobium sp.]MDP2962282.1 hypothetical protein [Sulfurimicrobium sp.]
MENSAGVALLVIGMVLGPGYYVYSHFLSGKVASSHPLTVKQEAAGNRFEPVQIELSPSMGKIGLILRFQTNHGPVMTPTQMPQNAYRATLKSGSRTVFDHPFMLTSTSLEHQALLNYSEAMPVFQADASGVYQLEIRPKGEAGMNLISAEVQVRQGLLEPSKTLMTAGFGMLVAGVAMLLF